MVFIKRVGVEEVYRCPFCGDSKNPRTGHLYVNVREGVYYCHRCHAKGRVKDLGFAPLEAPPPVVRPKNLDVDRRHLVYSRLLNLLVLYPRHQDDLERRGMSWSEIKRRQYRSIPDSPGVWRETLSVLGENLDGIPGLDGTYLGPGYLIPVRDPRGFIQGFQIRRDPPGQLTCTGEGEITLLVGRKKVRVSCPGVIGNQPLKPGLTVKLDAQIKVLGGPAVAGREPKYCWLSTNGQMNAVPHYLPGKGDVLWLVEGVLKADIFNALTGRVCVGFPGTGAWTKFDFKKLRYRKAAVAFDSEDNPVTQKETERLARACREAGLDAYIARWPQELGKGIDDVILNTGKDPESFLVRI